MGFWKKMKGYQISWVFEAMYPECGWGCPRAHGCALAILPSKEPGSAARIE
jgi:hypothetical protein